ncbi:hypothetical protein GCM10012275_64520 [Longimycelium tulufanense]|uniref:Uncharacterized protein n=1 Tax=Longimycelium tulufanense TaxID=907463 RepID=A0A8J3CFA6_9PSEU|nr:hypothetical protein [Longimycelium tulufanense]GGM84873.1 hypothetical protein GCM10012275_64520 [Longimycelium tulufanense]
MSENRTLDLAARQAASLRSLADMIEANPELAENFSGYKNTIAITVHTDLFDRVGSLARFARACKAAGATVAKEIDDKWHNVVATFANSVEVTMLAYREEVCERVVVGTREVVEEVPDPEAMAAVPTVKRKRTEEIVRWECRPLLAQDSDETRDGAA